MTTKPHDSARVMEQLAPAYGLRYAALPPPRKWCLISEGPSSTGTISPLAAPSPRSVLVDGTPLHVFPDPHSKRLATIMRPFLTKVVEGGDVYNQGK